jgi:hypothetical protein
MKVHLKLAGKYVGVDPSKPSVVYHDRATGGAWEDVDLQPQADGLFLARFIAADRVLSVQPDGRLETRPAGTDGAYELLRATTQPEGLDILYREADGRIVGVPLTIEEVK